MGKPNRVNLGYPTRKWLGCVSAEVKHPSKRKKKNQRSRKRTHSLSSGERNGNSPNPPKISQEIFGGGSKINALLAITEKLQIGSLAESAGKRSQRG